MAYSEDTAEIFEEISYEMYKAQWKKMNLSFEQDMDGFRSYLLQCMADYEKNGETTYTDDVGNADYDAYIREYGYSKNRKDPQCYASIEEFILNEFRDREYMHELLKDEQLIRLYDEIAADYEKVWEDVPVIEEIDR